MAVIAVVSIISGLNDYVAGKIFNLGPDVVTIRRSSPVITSFDDFVENQKRKYLYLPDMEAIHAACTDCKAVGAMVGGRGRIKFGREYVDSDVSGYTTEVAAILGKELDGGRFCEYADGSCPQTAKSLADVVAFFPFSSIRIKKPEHVMTVRLK